MGIGCRPSGRETNCYADPITHKRMMNKDRGAKLDYERQAYCRSVFSMCKVAPETSRYGLKPDRTAIEFYRELKDFKVSNGAWIFPRYGAERLRPLVTVNHGEATQKIFVWQSKSGLEIVSSPLLGWQIGSPHRVGFFLEYLYQFLSKINTLKLIL